MRRNTLILLLAFLPLPSIAQSESSLEQYHVVGPDRGYMPMSIAHFQNKKKWYAEGRYNYEALQTFSLHLGKTFSKESRLSYSLTPMLGGAIGNFNGVSTGLNMDFDFHKFFFSAQTQYSISTDQRSDNFFYNWTELGYQPLQWIYGGVSVQHTQLYKTKTVFEPGVLIGFNWRNLTIPFYTFAPLKANRYFMLGLTIEWAGSKKEASKPVELANLTTE